MKRQADVSQGLGAWFLATAMLVPLFMHPATEDWQTNALLVALVLSVQSIAFRLRKDGRG